MVNLKIFDETAAAGFTELAAPLRDENVLDEQLPTANASDNRSLDFSEDGIRPDAILSPKGLLELAQHCRRIGYELRMSDCAALINAIPFNQDSRTAEAALQEKKIAYQLVESSRFYRNGSFDGFRELLLVNPSGTGIGISLSMPDFAGFPSDLQMEFSAPIALSHFSDANAIVKALSPADFLGEAEQFGETEEDNQLVQREITADRHRVLSVGADFLGLNIDADLAQKIFRVLSSRDSLEAVKIELLERGLEYQITSTYSQPSPEESESDRPSVRKLRGMFHYERTLVIGDFRMLEGPVVYLGGVIFKDFRNNGSGLRSENDGLIYLAFVHHDSFALEKALEAGSFGIIS